MQFYDRMLFLLIGKIIGNSDINCTISTELKELSKHDSSRAFVVAKYLDVLPYHPFLTAGDEDHSMSSVKLQKVTRFLGSNTEWPILSSDYCDFFSSDKRSKKCEEFYFTYDDIKLYEAMLKEDTTQDACFSTVFEFSMPQPKPPATHSVRPYTVMYSSAERYPISTISSNNGESSQLN
jgi:hypothetical protein